MKIKRVSPITGIETIKEIDTTQHNIDLWMEGLLIQDAFPNVSMMDREFILTGMTEEDWKNVFGEEIDE
jgi:hypothetical protein